MENLLREMHQWMNGYIKTFYTDDEQVQQGIELKEKHTGYVTANSKELAEHLNLPRHDVQLAEIIGLFHDVGRFRQYSIYKTFNDADSEDHAHLSVKVLDELPFMQKLTERDLDIVRFAIENHNKLNIATTDDADKLLFAKMIRDADKLDIYRVLEPFLLNVKAAPKFVKSSASEYVSEDFIDDFVAGRQVDFYRIRTHGDRKLVRLMWVYDINFAWTLKKVVERGYVKKIADSLQPMNDKMKHGIVRLNEYIAKKCAEDETTVKL